MVHILTKEKLNFIIYSRYLIVIHIKNINYYKFFFYEIKFVNNDIQKRKSIKFLDNPKTQKVGYNNISSKLDFNSW